MSIIPSVAAEAETALPSGLSGGQKIGALGKALPKPKTNHPYIVGLSLIVIGGFALVGSITGTLPSMIAALFVPNALVDPSTGNSPGLFGVLQTVVNPIQTVVNPIQTVFSQLPGIP